MVCTAALQSARVVNSARAAGLHVIEHVDIVPRAGKDVLVMVDVMARQPAPPVRRSLTVRDAASQWTPGVPGAARGHGRSPRCR